VSIYEGKNIHTTDGHDRECDRVAREWWAGGKEDEDIAVRSDAEALTINQGESAIGADCPGSTYRLDGRLLKGEIWL